MFKRIGAQIDHAIYSAYRLTRVKVQHLTLKIMVTIVTAFLLGFVVLALGTTLTIIILLAVIAFNTRKLASRS